MLLREESVVDLGFNTVKYYKLSSATEDEHGMDTAFYNKHKIHSFLAIVKNRVFWFVFFFVGGGFFTWRKDYILTS